MSRLAGGQGRTWRGGEVALKPIDDPVEHGWVCAARRLAARLRGAGAAAATRTGRGVVGRLLGSALWLSGRTVRAGEHPDLFRAVCRRFHRVTGRLALPGFVAERDDAWTHGGRVAWADTAPVGTPGTRELVQRCCRAGVR